MIGQSKLEATQSPAPSCGTPPAHTTTHWLGSDSLASSMCMGWPPPDGSPASIIIPTVVWSLYGGTRLICLPVHSPKTGATLKV